MTMNVNISRKRLRSNDSEVCFALQRKTFVNQQMMDQQDPNKMKRILAKTISLLFQGAKNCDKELPLSHRESLKSVRLLGGGEIEYDMNVTASWLGKKADRNCRQCDRLSIVHADCTNCNLELCEHCGVNCNFCPEKICTNCVNIFH
uniref:Apoptosis regulatory protein Siva n=1 Tax=Anopheles dirus TaxID=7168 RepID=A0A182N3K8_9DIPT